MKRERGTQSQSLPEAVLTLRLSLGSPLTDPQPGWRAVMDGSVDTIAGHAGWDLRGGHWSVKRAAERRDQEAQPGLE